MGQNNCYVPEPGDAEIPLNRINMALVQEGKVIASSIRTLPWYAFSREPFERKDPEKPPTQRPLDKLHPLLQRWIAERPGDEEEFIVINFQDNLILPRFPEPPDDPEAYKYALQDAQALIAQIRQRRAPTYEKLRQELRQYFNAEVLQTFWLVNAVLVKVRLGAVAELARRQDVQYLEPRYSGEEPPDTGVTDGDDGNSDDDVEDGRTLLGSDALFNLGLTDGRIGLLDSGVRSTHILLKESSTLEFRGDCVNGGENCEGGDGFDPEDSCWDHGTSSAAILIANTKHGVAFRGVTAIKLDSFKVYPNSVDSEHCTGTLNVPAATNAFEAALAHLDKVIVAEIQSDATDLGMMATAADHAFDTGSAVIAANGNFGPNHATVKAPASAHKAIGVGEIEVVQPEGEMFYQSRGPAPDGRHKPDIQAPTQTETASSAFDTAFRIHKGTSGATPYAAGAAALLRNWLAYILKNNNPPDTRPIMPGEIYAHLILAGPRAYPFDDIEGAGPLRLTVNGGIAWGTVSVHDGETIFISLPVSATSTSTLDGALWWPETGAQPDSFLPEIHNDIDLALVPPKGDPRDESVDDDGVFERAHVEGTIEAGEWKLRIQGCHVPGGAQTVYWAARGPFTPV